MNSTPYLHLAWKEYRAARGFWLAVVVLTLLLQALILITMREGDERGVLLLNFALGAPAFFAAGIAGTAFSVEREEGTFDFLRASPITPRQTLLSKLAVGVLATAAMYLILAPIAYWFTPYWFTQGRLPFQFQLSHLWGLWGIAAIEGLAWGTLFSLTCARPLLAVCLALFATSSVTHLVSWTTLESGPYNFGLAAYSAAIPQRLLVIALVLAADVYLGLRWLRGPAEQPPTSNQGAKSTRVLRPPAGFVRGPAAAPEPPQVAGRQLHFQSPAVERPSFSPAGATYAHPELATLRTKRSRAAMLGHLLWQQWRQSRGLMVVLGAIFVASALIARYSDIARALFYPNVSLAILAALMGACVFFADQERSHYRYFVEHNVPPRYVWFSRLAPWLVALLIVTAVAFSFSWGGHQGATADLERILRTDDKVWRPRSGYAIINMPLISLDLTWIIVSFSAGQWASMFVRSGLLAGFVGLVLSCVLCAWAALMQKLPIPWWWCVAPIPLFLLWATWLRAPDWVRENSRWSARLRAAAVVMLPAVVLVATVARHRVHEISAPPAGLPADAASLASIPPSALATAEKYREAQRLFSSSAVSSESSVGSIDDDGPSGWDQLHRPTADRTLAPDEKSWLDANAEPLNLMLAASAEPACLLDDPRTCDGVQGAPWGLFELVLLSARQLECEGQLDAALDRFFVALKICEHWASYQSVGGSRSQATEVFAELRTWGVQKGQTAERVTAALERLKAVSPRMLRLQDRLKANLILERRLIDGDESAAYALRVELKPAEEEQRRLWERFMPWERERERRLVNFIHSEALHRLAVAETKLKAGESARMFVVPDRPITPTDYFHTAYDDWNDPDSLRQAAWLETTLGGNVNSGVAGIAATRELVNFEADRRGTMLVLAVEAYRLKNGALPGSLRDLLGTYFDELPIDPYSGVPFRYLREGVSIPKAKVDQEEPGIPEDWFSADRLFEDWLSGDWLAVDWRAQDYELDRILRKRDRWLREDDQMVFEQLQLEPGQPAIWCSNAELTLSIRSDDSSRPVDRAENDANVLFGRDPTTQYLPRMGGDQYVGRIQMAPAIALGTWFPIPKQAE